MKSDLNTDIIINATCQIINVIGWKPHHTQKKPLKRGSAQASMKDISIDPTMDDQTLKELTEQRIKELEKQMAKEGIQNAEIGDTIDHSKNNQNNDNNNNDNNQSQNDTQNNENSNNNNDTKK